MKLCMLMMAALAACAPEGGVRTEGITYGTTASCVDVFYIDFDRDGYGDPASDTTTACKNPGTGYAANTDDCDDGNARVNPDVIETCNGLDDDCNGAADDGDIESAPVGYWDADGDGDGHGVPDVTTLSCDKPEGYAAVDDDCDDRSADVHPGKREVCDGADNDCDDAVDDNASDGVDYYPDGDGDGYGQMGAAPQGACELRAGFIIDDATDCDDGNPDAYPGASETCNWMDDDCDGAMDEDVADMPTWYPDDDGDGAGAEGVGTQACDAPDWFFVENDRDCNDFDVNVNHDVDNDGDLDDACTDCDDTDAVIYTGAEEACSATTDFDCDGTPGIDDSDAECMVPITCMDTGTGITIGITIPVGWDAWETSGFVPWEIMTVVTDRGDDQTGRYEVDGVAYAEDIGYSSWYMMAISEDGPTAFSDMRYWYVDQDASDPDLCDIDYDSTEFYVLVP